MSNSQESKSNEQKSNGEGSTEVLKQSQENLPIVKQNCLPDPESNSDSKKDASSKTIQTSLNSNSPRNIFKNIPLQDQVRKQTGENIFQGLGMNNLNSVNLFNVTASDLPPSNIFHRCAQEKPLISSDVLGNESSPQKIARETGDEDQSKSFSASLAKQVKQEEKVMKFDYEKPQYEKIKQWKVLRFRNSSNPTKNNILVSLERVIDQKAVIYLIAKTSETFLTLQQSIIMRTISKTGQFMGKDENLKIDVLRSVDVEGEGEDGKTGKKLVKEVVKIQFLNKEECQEFKTIVDQFLGDSKSE